MAQLESVDRKRATLWVIAAILFGVLAFVAVRYAGTVVLGLFLYYITRPTFERIRSRVGNRTLAALLALLVLALPVLVLFTWTMTVAVRQTADFLASDAFAEYRTLLQPYVDVSAVVGDLQETGRTIVDNPQSIRDLQLDEVVGGALGTAVASVGFLATGLLHLFIALVVAFYLLRDDHRLVGWARSTFVDEDDGVVAAYVALVDRDLERVYFGNILNAVVTAVLGAVTYNLLAMVAPASVTIPRPTLLGLLTGAASLIPVIGMKLVWIPASVIVFVDAAVAGPTTVWFPVVFVLVSVVIVDYIPDQFLRPYVSGRSLHVGAVMLAYILGTLLFGWYGIFLGPLLLVLVFEFGRVVVPWLVDPEEWQPPPAFLEGEPVEEPGAVPSVGDRVRTASVRAATAGRMGIDKVLHVREHEAGDPAADGEPEVSNESTGEAGADGDAGPDGDAAADDGNPGGEGDAGPDGDAGPGGDAGPDGKRSGDDDSVVGDGGAATDRAPPEDGTDDGREVDESRGTGDGSETDR